MLLVLGFITSCYEPIKLKMNINSNILVVDGYISDIKTIHQIKLSYSTRFENFNPTPLIYAEVSVSDNSGNIYVFTENRPGHYYSLDSFAVIENTEYQLHIRTSDNLSYTSIPQTLNKVLPIQDIQFEATTIQKLNHNNEIEDVNGLNTLVPINNPTEENQFFKFNFTETYIYQADLALKNSSHKNCWLTDYEKSVMLVSKKGGLNNLTIGLIPHNYKQEVRYSLLIEQFGLNHDSYKYWSEIKNQLENNGSIFDTMPFPIEGNVYNTNNSSDKILGFFGVYSVSAKRVYLDLNDFPFSYEIDPNRCAGPMIPLECFNCMYYRNYQITNIKPTWWN